MKDKRIEKIKQHYDIYINDVKFKVIDCNINKDAGILSLKTKIKGQNFPKSGQFTIVIPSSEYSETVHAEFHFMCNNTKIESWEYFVE